MNVRFTDKRQKILDSTVELIAENGLHNTPMSLVSKRSGVSAGAIYHHFSSKEDLINQLYLLEKERMTEATFARLDEEAPFKQQFFQLWEAVYQYYLEYPHRLSFIEQCANSPVITQETLAIKYDNEQKGMQFLARGVEQGDFRQMDLLLLGTLIFSQILAVVKLQLSGGSITDEMKHQAMHSTWDGVRTQ